MSELELAISRRMPWLGVLLILLILSLLIWMAQDAAPEPTATFKPAAPPRQQADSARLIEQAAALAGVLPPGASASVAVALGPDQVEVCGLGAVKADESGQPADMTVLQAPLRQAREQLLLALAQSPDEVSQAAGLLIGSVEPPAGADAELPASALPLPNAHAVPGRPVLSPPSGAASKTPTVAREALASLALATRSPQVYAFALQACAMHRQEGTCRMLSVEQWARLDPGNGAPWVQLVQDASERGDAAGVSEAMHRVAQASQVDSRVASALGLAMAKVPPTTPLVTRVGLASELMGVSFGALPSYSALSRQCSAQDLRDANRQQACAAVAEALVSRGTTLMDLLMGTAIGEWAGWPADRTQRLRDERDAMSQVLSSKVPAPRKLWGCESLQQMQLYFTDLAQLGEMAAMRKALKASPDSVAELARRHREARAAATQKAAASAPAGVAAGGGAGFGAGVNVGVNAGATAGVNAGVTAAGSLAGPATGGAAPSVPPAGLTATAVQP